MALAYKVKLEYNWGFSASVPGLAKTNPTHPYPPLTTVIGAIGEVLAKDHMLGEYNSHLLMKELSRNILVATYRAINYVPVKYQDLNKIIVVKESNKPTITDAPARGKTITVPLMQSLPPILEIVLAFNSETISCCNKKMKIDPEVLWSIHRIGSKESIVNIWSVEKIISEGEFSRSSKIKTCFAFPVSYVKQIGHTNCLWEIMWQVNPYTPESWHKTPAMSYTFGVSIIPYMVPIKSKIEPNIQCLIEIIPKSGVFILDIDGVKAIGRKVENFE